MFETDSPRLLPLVSAASGCSCCSTKPSEDSVPVTADAEYVLEGLTCGHCVQTVEKALSGVDGVDAVTVQLVPGGRSRLTVSGAADDEAVRDAVASAGYSLISS